MHYLRFKECLVILVLFHLGSSSPPCERSSLCRSAPSLDDFPEDYVIFYGDDGVTPSIGHPKIPPSTPKPSSTPEPLSTEHPYKFYIDQLKKKSDSNQEKKLPQFYNMDNPVEHLRIKLHKLVNVFIDWIKNLD